MRDLKEITKNLETTRTFRVIAEAFQESAVMKMRKVRDSVVHTRQFTEEITHIFTELKIHYKITKLKLDRNNADFHKYQVSTLKKKDRTLAVLVTPDEGLSGEISNVVYEKFAKYIKENEVDVVIIGKVGREKFQHHPNSRVGFQYYGLPNPKSDLYKKEIQSIADFIIKYQDVYVFHGRFQNLMSQVVNISNIAGETNPDLKINANVDLDIDYLFEPSIETILNFFEVQIFTALFKQTLSESLLAKLGSRVSAMEAAIGNTEKMIKLLNAKKHRMENMIKNKKQLERLAGVVLSEEINA